ncbi:MAG: DUF2335 domain-containing protein [Nevskia sp.]|nr:DUF2335 domain-containing protein [Nevskia sp.]
MTVNRPQMPNDDAPQTPVDKVVAEVARTTHDLPPERQEEIANTMRMALLETRFSGPLPPPDMLAKYQEIIANGAERIMASTEREQAHRHYVDKALVDAEIATASRGQIMAFILALVCIAVALVLGLYSHDVLAGVIGGGTLVSVVTIFIVGRKNKNGKPKDDTESQ